MDKTNGMNTDWREKLLHQIDTESDDLQKAHLMRCLSLKLFNEARLLQTGPLLEAASEQLRAYLNFVDHSEAVQASRSDELTARIGKSQVQCSLGDAKEYFKRFRDEHSASPIGNIQRTSESAFSDMHSGHAPKLNARNLMTFSSTTKPDLATGQQHNNAPSTSSSLSSDIASRIASNEPTTAKEAPNHAKFVYQPPNRVRSSQSTMSNRTLNDIAAQPFHKKSDNNGSIANIDRNYTNGSHARHPSNDVQAINNKRKLQSEYVAQDQPHSFKYFNPDASRSIINQRAINQPPVMPANDFRTGAEELRIRYEKKYGNPTSNGHQDHQPQQLTLMSYGVSKKSLGSRRNVSSKFVPPVPAVVAAAIPITAARHEHVNRDSNESSGSSQDPLSDDERLRCIDPKMIEVIRNEIMHTFSKIGWDDIAGLEYAKATIKEAVVWPILRPDIFTGLRRPPRGILLFGPPGTGKTLIGKCIASQSNSTFFSISASTLTSKWIGEGEKMVRALFAVAGVYQPAVVFIDEIDSLLCQRSENEHESSRRLKTEFLVQLDGAATPEHDRILIVGATNRPQELDEAARRRLVKRLYIPLPELEARVQILRNLLRSERTEITDDDLQRVGEMTDGFSGADMKTLCHEASMGPIRTISETQMNHVDLADVRPVTYADFQAALDCVRASVSRKDLAHYIEWDRTYGSGASKMK